jgi:hypothetical protein
MKKIILVFVAIFALSMSFVSNGAVASVYEMTDYDTGIKADAPTDTVRLEWKFEACYPSFYYGVADVEWRHTTPKSAEPGGFSGFEQGGYWESGYWYGWVDIDSWITGSKGTNHGDITITFSNGYPQELSWSFNIRHS